MFWLMRSASCRRSGWCRRGTARLVFVPLERADREMAEVQGMARSGSVTHTGQTGTCYRLVARADRLHSRMSTQRSKLRASILAMTERRPRPRRDLAADHHRIRAGPVLVVPTCERPRPSWSCSAASRPGRPPAGLPSSIHELFLRKLLGFRSPAHLSLTPLCPRDLPRPLLGALPSTTRRGFRNPVEAVPWPRCTAAAGNTSGSESKSTTKPPGRVWSASPGSITPQLVGFLAERPID